MSDSQLRQIINDSAAEIDSTSPEFWVMVAALKVGALSWDISMFLLECFHILDR